MQNSSFLLTAIVNVQAGRRVPRIEIDANGRDRSAGSASDISYREPRIKFRSGGVRPKVRVCQASTRSVRS